MDGALATLAHLLLVARLQLLEAVEVVEAVEMVETVEKIFALAPTPVPVLVPGPYYSPSGDENNKSTYIEFSGQSCTTPCGAAHFLLF
jgi:hypothetical protein